MNCSKSSVKLTPKQNFISQMEAMRQKFKSFKTQNNKMSLSLLSSVLPSEERGEEANRERKKEKEERKKERKKTRKNSLVVFFVSLLLSLHFLLLSSFSLFFFLPFSSIFSWGRIRKKFFLCSYPAANHIKRKAATAFCWEVKGLFNGKSD